MCRTSADKVTQTFLTRNAKSIKVGMPKRGSDSLNRLVVPVTVSHFDYGYNVYLRGSLKVVLSVRDDDFHPSEIGRIGVYVIDGVIERDEDGVQRPVSQAALDAIEAYAERAVSDAIERRPKLKAMILRDHAERLAKVSAKLLALA